MKVQHRDFSMDLGNVDSDMKNLLIVGGGLLALYVFTRGVGGVTKDVTRAVVNAATGVVVGTVTGVSESIGLPTPDETTTDPAVARYIIDDPDGGYLAASQWASLSAYVRGLAMPVGSGHPPPPNSAIAQHFPPYLSSGQPYHDPVYSDDSDYGQNVPGFGNPL